MPLFNWDSPVASFDSETTGFKPQRGARPFLWGMHLDCGEVIVGEKGTKAYRRIVSVLEDPAVAKVAHHLKFDLRQAEYDGITIRGELHDTMLMAAITDEYEQSFNLEKLSQKHLRFIPDNQTLLNNWKAANKAQIRSEYHRDLRYSDMPRRIIVPYLEDDVTNTIKLFFYYKKFIAQHFDELYWWEMQLVPALMRIETRGVCTDQAYIAEMRNVMETKNAQMLEGLRQLTNNWNFNPGSATQVAYYIKRFGFQLDREDYGKNGQPKTGKDVLEKYITKVDKKTKEIIVQGHPFVDGLVEYRRTSKLKGTYLDALMDGSSAGVIHQSLWQGSSSKEVGIRTQRLSASDPSLQTVPARDATTIRRCFVPRPGCAMIYLDYSQIEMLVFLDLFKVPSMIEAAQRGEDFHAFTGRALADIPLEEWARMATSPEDSPEFKLWKELRQIGKSCNFAVIFGSGVRTFSETAGLPFNEGKKKLDQYFQLFPEIKDVQREQTRALLTRGYVVDRSGRRYHVPRDLAYKAVNAVVQGEAANVMKRGLVQVDRFLLEWREANWDRIMEEARGIPPALVNTIHDELHNECPIPFVDEVIPACIPLMEREDFEIPIRVDVEWTTTSWADKRKWKISETKFIDLIK